MSNNTATDYERDLSHEREFYNLGVYRALSKEFYKLEIKTPSYHILAKKPIWRIVTSSKFDHNASGMDAAFELIGDAQVKLTGKHFSAMIISSRDDVIYDQEFNVPVAPPNTL